MGLPRSDPPVAYKENLYQIPMVDVSKRATRDVVLCRHYRVGAAGLTMEVLKLIVKHLRTSGHGNRAAGAGRIQSYDTLSPRLPDGTMWTKSQCCLQLFLHKRRNRSGAVSITSILEQYFETRRRSSISSAGSHYRIISLFPSSCPPRPMGSPKEPFSRSHTPCLD